MIPVTVWRGFSSLLLSGFIIALGDCQEFLHLGIRNPSHNLTDSVVKGCPAPTISLNAFFLRRKCLLWGVANVLSGAGYSAGRVVMQIEYDVVKGSGLEADV